MTRINCVSPRLLSRQHLIAEYRELPRVFALVEAAQRRGKKPEDYRGDSYVLGAGHVTFFYTRLGWCVRRYRELVGEMKRRGHVVRFEDVKAVDVGSEWYGDWVPDDKARAVNMARLIARDPNFYVRGA